VPFRLGNIKKLWLSYTEESYPPLFGMKVAFKFVSFTDTVPLELSQTSLKV
jgi:hypothetical protein